MSERRGPAGDRHGLVKIAIGITALLCLLIGLVLYLFAGSFGISEETARIMAIAFLAAGAGDYLVLKFWDRFAGRR